MTEPSEDKPVMILTNYNQITMASHEYENHQHEEIFRQKGQIHADQSGICFLLIIIKAATFDYTLQGHYCTILNRIF